MKEDNFKVYGYRWVMLVVFMFIVAVNQLLWITFASITSDAVKFYGVSDLSIGLLSMIFMIVYIVISIPASWVIDTYGLRVAVGIGAALTGIFGLMRGLAASSYTLVLVAQIGIAVGQPFILNAVTTVAARWFPVRERATASGLGSLAMYLGIFLGLGLTPILTIHFQIGGMLVAYGIAVRGRCAGLFRLCQGAAGDTALPSGDGSALAGLRRLQTNVSPAEFHPAPGHLLCRAGGLQCHHHLDREYHRAARFLQHPGRDRWRADDRRRHCRRPDRPVLL